jgi:MYXO-CTERM domain-containing protein
LRLRLLCTFVLCLSACRSEREPTRPQALTRSVQRASRVVPSKVGPEAARPSLRAAWLQAVQARSDAGHEARAAGKHAIMDNRAHALHADLDERVLRIRSERVGESHDTSFRLERYGCTAVAAAQPHISGSRVTLARGAVTEWYKNGPLGVEQGFDLAEPPACAAAGELELAIEVRSDLSVSVVDGQRLELRDAAGTVALRYTDLYAIDADGRALPSRMALTGNTVSLLVDGRGARFPVRVDPLIWAQVGQPIQAGTPIADDRFGSAVAISGDTAVVGAPNNDDIDTDAGQVHVFTRNSPGSWTERVTLQVGVTAGAHFGSAVAISTAGASKRVVIGAPDDNGSGSASWFLGSGATWAFEQTRAPITALGGEQFGLAVDVSGDRVIVGGPGFANFDGYAAIFEPIATVWTEVGTFLGAVGGLEIMGTAVAIDGNLAVAGASGRSAPAANGGGYDIFLRTAGVWARTQSVGNTVVDRASGSSLALSGTTLINGAPGLGAGPGEAFVDTLTASGTLGTSTALSVPGGVLQNGDFFGFAVAVDANLAVIGAPDRMSETGDAFVFENLAGTWTFQPPVVSRKATSAGERFGNSVTVDAASRVVIAGAPGNDGTATDSGAAYEIIERLSNGDPCAADIACASDFCIDGVCCNTLCGRTGAFGSEPQNDCQACSTAAGAATDGTCGPRAANTVCGIGSGLCRPNTVCDGTSPTCPPVVLLGNGTPCRPAISLCDLVETCDGSSSTCPANQFAAMGTVCRPVNGGCDVQEVCNGSSGSCPFNAARPSGFVCRGAAGDCDLEELCDGSSTTCPTDVFRASGFECRATAGMCDVAETCTGTEAACPNNGFVADGTMCTGGFCLAGTCTPPPDLAGLDLANVDLGGIDLGNFDLSVAPDAAPEGGIYGGGCSCDVSGTRDTHGAGALAMLVLLGLLLPRRRRGGCR